MLILAFSFIAMQMSHPEKTLPEKKKSSLCQSSDSEAGIDNPSPKHQRRPNTTIARAKTNTAPLLQENLNNGRFIRLSDNSLWEINPKDTPVTQGWITPVAIMSTPSGDSAYPFKLTNSLTGSSVLAKRAQSAAPPPAPLPKK